MLWLSLALLLSSAQDPKKIVLIAGPKDDHPKETHEYEKNVALLKHCLETSSNLKGVKVEVHLGGWPKDEATLDDADTIFLTSGGSDRRLADHPLYVGNRMGVLERQMKRGCGLVFHHWSTFHPVKEHDRITEWVGGYFDYETGPPPRKWYSAIETREWTTAVASPDHPIARGLKPFKVKEEFYFKIRFRDDDPRLKPILLRQAGGDVRKDTVGWAVERKGGGRGFGFTGGHFYANWNIPEFRKLVLNAIVWTARLEVPPEGVESTLQESKEKGLLPSDPGLDGGKGGHWGLAGEKDWVDGRWSQSEVGPFVTSALALPDGKVARAISIRLGDDAAVVFDAERPAIRAGWTGRFIAFSPARYGLIEMPRIAGDLQFVAPRAEKGRYKGLYLNGRRVVLSYDDVLESPWIESGEAGLAFMRTFQGKGAATLLGGPGSLKEIDGVSLALLESGEGVTAAAAVGGSLRVDESTVVMDFSGRAKSLVWRGPKTDLGKFAALVRRSPAPEDLDVLARGGAPRWTEVLTTKGHVSKEKGPYVIDTLTLPYVNPWKALLFLGGFDFFGNGDAAACSIHGDVWTVGGIDGKLERLSWRRYATGLYQALGLRIVGDQVYVLGRDQITRLHDLNGDGEADFYENFSSAPVTSAGGHDYATCLETDAEGNFYYVNHLGVHRVSADGRRHETLATGFRNPNGMSVGASVTVAPQEGEWTPASMICEIKPGGYYGYGGPKKPVEPPLCYLPRLIDNSSGGQVWVTGDRWGPLAEQLLNLSFGRCTMQLVLREKVKGRSQGAVVPIKLNFASGIHRGRFSARDGQLYVVGTKGWVSSAVRDGCFQRVRYTGEKAYLPVAFNTAAGGIRVTFAEPLDRELAEDPDSYALEQWNYRYSEKYGSEDYSALRPSAVGHDPVEVKSAKLSDDGRTVFLAIPDLRPVMQLRVRYGLKSADGAQVRGEVVATLHQLP